MEAWIEAVKDESITFEARDDQQLLSAYIRSGDVAALGCLFERHCDAAYRMARRVCGNTADADDIVQTAFIQVMRHAGQQHEQAAVRGWIMSIVINTAKMKMREEGRRRALQENASPPSSGVSNSQQQELFSIVVDALERLPEHYRLPLWLHHYEGFSLDEVAKALNTTENTIHSQLSRGMERLRTSLATAGCLVASPAIVDALLTVPREVAPSGVMAAVKGIATLKTATVVTAGKGFGMVLTAKIAVGVAALLAVLAAFVASIRQDNGSVANAGRTPIAGETKDDQKPEAQPASQRNIISKRLAEILARKVGTTYRRYYFSEVLKDLETRMNLLSAYPGPLANSFEFSLNAPDATVRELLEKLAAAGKLDLEYRNEVVVFWKKADDKLLAGLAEKFKNGDSQARSEAVVDLTRLSDPRIYPIIYSAFADKDPMVAAWAFGKPFHQMNGLWAHLATFGFGENSGSVVPSLQKLYNDPPVGSEPYSYLFFAAASRSKQGLQFLCDTYKATVNSKNNYNLIHNFRTPDIHPLQNVRFLPFKSLSGHYRTGVIGNQEK